LSGSGSKSRYELANRVSASRLAAIAEILDVTVGYFFVDLETSESALSAEEKQTREGAK